MVFIVVISSVLLAVCASLKPIYLQNAIDAVDAGAGGTLTMFLCYAASILGILLFETARQLSTGKYRAAFFVRKMQRLQADNILRNAQHRVKK